MYNNFSVVICTYNRRLYIEKCLEKILQSNILPKKIIIVDQNNDYLTSQIAKKILKKKNYYNFLIIKNLKKGLTFSKNIALKFIDHKYVFFIDDDVLINKSFFYSILESMKITNATAISGVIANCKKTKLNIFLHHLFNYGPYRDNRYIFNNFKKMLLNNNYLVPTYQVPGGITCFKKDIFKYVKFDEKIITHNYEDVDFCIRVKKKIKNTQFFLNLKALAEDRIENYKKENIKKKLQAMFLLFKKNKSFYFFIIFIISFLAKIFFAYIFKKLQKIFLKIF
jgi:glycosyltransferase involved in cell wall biosynthesis